MILKYIYRFVVSAFALSLLPALSAIQIQLDYSFDTTGFFDDPEARKALEAAAGFFEAVLDDELLEINADTFDGNVGWTARLSDPSSGILEVPDLVVLENTIVVFVGARTLPETTLGVGGPGGFSVSATRTQSTLDQWFDLVQARGKAGALDTPSTDFGPWGGGVFFNETTDWHFQLDGRPAGTSKRNFVSVALHELAHLLGVGTADSWNDQIEVINGQPHFTGAEAMLSYDGPVPLDDDLSHFDFSGCVLSGTDPDNVNSLTIVSFGRPHGAEQSAIMDPISCVISSSAIIDVFTDLDLAALQDIGWQLRVAGTLQPEVLEPANVSFTWPSTTGLVYTLERSTDLNDWTALVSSDNGDGSLAEFTDSSSPPDRAFYRLRVESSSPGMAMSGVASAAATSGGSGDGDAPTTFSRSPRLIDTCSHHCCQQ